MLIFQIVSLFLLSEFEVTFLVIFFSVKSWMIATKNLGGRNKRQCPIYKIDLFIKAQTEARF